MQAPNFLWITDPWSTLDRSQDTTLRLLQEGVNMGIPTFWSSTETLFKTTDLDSISAVEVKNPEDALDLSHPKLKRFKTSIFHQIHFRVDPPVDEKYRKFLEILVERGANTHAIVNPPDLILHQSEKIPPDDLLDLAPRMLRVKGPEDIKKLTKLFAHEEALVSKPLHLAQSVGVKKHPVPKTDQEWGELISALVQNDRREILIEEFLPEIRNGEVRLWFSDGHFIGALKKFPKPGDFRVLIDEGSSITRHQPDLEEEKIIRKISASLRKQKILFAAVDLIGNKICDYNITSPGLLVQLEKVHEGKNLARKILNRALEYHARMDRE